MANKNSSIVFNADDMMGDVEVIVNHGYRRVGSPGGLALEATLANRLREYGFESVRLEPINVVVWTEDRTTLEVYRSDGTIAMNPAVQAIPYAAFSAEAGINAPLLFASSTSDLADCQGKIVVVDIGFPALNTKLLLGIAIDKHDPDNTLPLVDHPATWVRVGWHLYREATARGAAGFIGILKDQPGGTCKMHGPYGFREENILDKPLPGVWIGKKEGAALKSLAQAGGATARLTATGTAANGISNNVVAELPGTDLDHEVVVLSCHHDSPFKSPVEDATGCAVVLALAKRLAAERNLRRRVVVLFTAGHFYGSIGTRKFIEEHEHGITKRTVLEISIEHVALEAAEGPDGSLVATGRPEPQVMFVSFSKAIADAVMAGSTQNDLDRTILLPAEGPLGNYPPTDGGDWFEAGIPVINCISNPVYLLTDEDDWQWVDRPRLPRVAGAFYDIMHQLDGVSRQDLAKTKSWPFRLVMKALRLMVSAISTRLWTRKFY